LELGEQQAENPIAGRRRPPVEGDDRRAGGTDRFGEPGKPDVDRADALGQWPGRKADGHQSAAPTSGAADASPAPVAPPAPIAAPARAAIAAASIAARALLDSSMTPTSARIRSWRSRPCGSRSVPQTEATTSSRRPPAVARALASAIAGAGAPAGR